MSYDLVFMYVFVFRCVFFFFFFKQKTAYEMRISDWSSDVCSSDLHRVGDLEKFGSCKSAGIHSWSRSQEVSSLILSGILPGIVPGILAGARRTGRLLGLPAGSDQIVGQHQIGRASCRERVCQYV